MKLIKLLLALSAVIALFAACNTVITVPVYHNPEVPMIYFVVCIFLSIMAAALPSDIHSIEY